MAIPRFNEIFTEVLLTLENEPMLHRRELQDRVVVMLSESRFVLVPPSNRAVDLGDLDRIVFPAGENRMVIAA